MLAPGTVVDQKFEIVSAMAMGGFGVIYRANQLGFDRVVVLKVLQSHAEIDHEDIRRFEREARILSQLRHRNLVLFYGFGEYEGNLYIAMEMVQGKSLEVALGRRGRLPLDETISILKQVCEALMCSHSHGVVHRDLKPTNIMLCETPEGVLVKLIDFGLAMLITADISTMQKITAAGNTVGSVEYMSPEQCVGKPTDDRSDIYSLGCVLHYCITGEPPFTGDNAVVVMRRHVDDAPPRLAKLIADPLPRELQYVIDKALAKDPDDRYEDIGEFLADLEAIEKGSGAKLIADKAPVARPRRGVRISRRGLMTKVSVVLTASVFAIALMGALVEYFKLAFPQEPRITSIRAWYEARKLDVDKAENDPRRRPIVAQQYAKVLDLNNEDRLIDQNQLAQIYWRLGVLHANSGDYEKGMHYSQKAVQLFMDDNAFAGDLQNAGGTLMDCATHLGRQSEALHQLEKIAKAWPESPSKRSVRLQLATAYSTAGDYESALDVLAQLRQETPPTSREYKPLLAVIEATEAKLTKK
jgi:tRNA A-37 threonylcarbamoyl transferase component Bud32/tetratricopeptide (TPR) repeat protein